MAITAIRAGKVFTPSEEIQECVILIEGGRVLKIGARDSISIPIGAEIIDHKSLTVIPGLIDMHIHGAAGHDFMEATPEAVTAIGAYLARNGTTSYVATTVTASLERTVQAATALSEIIRGAKQSDHSGKLNQPPVAEILGIQFEGPFLSVVKRGAHPAADIKPPTAETWKKLFDAAGGAAMVLALAPEMEGALEVLALARQAGVRVGIGHSNATFEEAQRALDAGATHAVHTYNAMRPFSHHDPGILGAVLSDDRLCAELICDGVHVQPAAVRVLIRAKGMDRIILITDSLSAAGMPDGDFQLGEFKINVVKGICRTPEGRLAGSSITLAQGLRNLMKFSGLTLRECLPCATVNPARLLGLEGRKGTIAGGADADMVVLDQNYQVKQTYVKGRASIESD